MSVWEKFKEACSLGKKAEEKQTLLQSMSLDGIERLKAVVCARWEMDMDSETQQRSLMMESSEASVFVTRLLHLGIPFSAAPDGKKARISLDEKGVEAMRKHEAAWQSLRSEAEHVVARMPVGEPVTVQSNDVKFRGAFGQQKLYPLKLDAMQPGQAFLVPKALCALGIEAYRLLESEESGASFAIDPMGALMVGQYRNVHIAPAGDCPQPGRSGGY